MMPSCSVCEGLTGQDKGLDIGPEALLRSADAGCPSCTLLLEGVRFCVPDRPVSTMTGVYVQIFVPEVDEMAPGEDPQCCYVWATYEDRYEAEIEFFTLKDDTCPWRISPKARIPESTASTVSCSQALQWLQKCLTTHEKCGATKAAPLPTRILDVSGPDVKLHLASDGEEGSYVCLSHRWGSSQTVVTTRQTLEERVRGISWPSLSKTFQDAVEFVRKLDVQFLWIDSLCILQDDSSDWQIESGRMASVYENALLTIAATASSSCDGGLYRLAADKELISSVESVPCRVYVRPQIKHWATGKDWPGEHQYPLLTRGWVFQERLLARRILHFASKELVWECKEMAVCQCKGMKDVKGKIRHNLKSTYGAVLAQPSQKQLEVLWRETIEGYSWLHLTKPSDKLPALSGLVKKMQSFRQDTYLAGLWRASLSTDLLWYTHYGQRPKKWRAPSWSWASLDGAITYITGIGYEIWENHLLDINVECVPAGLDPTGEILSGKLTVSATMVTAIICSYEPPKDAWNKHRDCYEITHAGRTERDFWPDFPFASFYTDGKFEIGLKRKVQCVLVASSMRTYVSLVLGCLDPDKQLYRRMGLLSQKTYDSSGRSRSDPNPWYDSPGSFQVERITIV